MNSCRMTFRILIALLAMLAFVSSLALAAKVDPKPASIKPIGNTGITEETRPPEPVKPPQDEDLVYDITSKVSPVKLGAPEVGSRSGILTEGFETSVPPSGWSTIINNSGYTWGAGTSGPHTGLQNATVIYDPLPGAQDEWLVSSTLNFASSNSNLNVSFWWNMSYYWGVTPYDNYNLELWISTNGGATWPTKLWDESAQGVFTTWTWYQTTISLAAYVGQTNVKLAWRYVGTDGAQGSLDDIYVNDDGLPTGRCCYDAGASCKDNTAPECAAIGGTWNGTKTCANPCPTEVGNTCGNPIIVTLPSQLPYNDLSQFTCGRVNDYTGTTCLGYYDSGEDIIYRLVVTAALDLKITVNPKGTTYAGFAIGTACPLTTTNCVVFKTNSSSGSAFYANNVHLDPGTYYLQIDTWSTPDCIPDFDLKIEVAPPPPAGALCSTAIPVAIAPGLLPVALTTQTNCGLGANYTNTCLASYDGGENILYKLNVAAPTDFAIRVDPKGTTYTGILVDGSCPPNAATCLYKKTVSGTGVYTLSNISLPAGTFYVMLSTYPSPNCIPNFDITFIPPPVGRCCYSGTCSDITQPACTILGGTWDGTKTCALNPCPTGPSGIDCATAIPVTLNPVTFPRTITDQTTCGAGNEYTETCLGSYDGGEDRVYKLTIAGTGNVPINVTMDPKGSTWTGWTIDATCPVNGTTCLFTKTNSGSAPYTQKVTLVGGSTYYMIVDTWPTPDCIPDYSLTFSTPPPAPWNDECQAVTPTVLTMGTPVTFTGTTTGSNPDCASFGKSNVWEAFTLTQCANVTLNYCGTSPAYGNCWLNLAVGCPCASFTPAGAFETSSCGDGNVTIVWSGLAAGTYYYPVMNDLTYGADGPYTIHVVAQPVTAYCEAGSDLCDEFISNVVVGTIDNASDCSGGYTDYTALSTDMAQGLSYAITVTNGYGYTSDQCGIFIDWNNDFCFSPDEIVAVSGNPGGGPYTALIDAPCNVSLGAKLMRIRITYSETPSPCGISDYGEVEDYTINLIAGPTAPPVTVVLPDPQYAYYTHALTPVINQIYVGNFTGTHLAPNVNLATVRVNGEVPTSASVAYCGGALKVLMPLTDFIDNYGLLWDVTHSTFAVTGSFTDATTFSYTGDVTLIGHRSAAPAQYIVPPQVVVLPGDFDVNGYVNISDPVAMIAYIFASGPAPSNLLIGDVNCSGGINISDAVYMISYIFHGGAAPCK